MSNYNPVPARVWSRVQSKCTFMAEDTNTNTNTNTLNYYRDLQMRKGNVLQYKANSASFTKVERYARAVKGCGPNRKKLYATQSETYTNPNTSNMARSGYTVYPNETSNNSSNPCATILDGGTLICGTLATPCSNEILKSAPKSSIICNPSSASNVPGSHILCWDYRVQPWYPKPRYVMNTTTDKWPQGYKAFVSAVRPVAPVVYLISQLTDSVTIAWAINKSSNCMPITAYNIYVNNQIYATVNNSVTSYSVLLSSGSGSNIIIYVISVSSSISSNPSNIIELRL